MAIGGTQLFVTQEPGLQMTIPGGTETLSGFGASMWDARNRRCCSDRHFEMGLEKDNKVKTWKPNDNSSHSLKNRHGGAKYKKRHK